MKITWDEPKRATNLRDHGLDFADAVDFDWMKALIVESHAGSRGGRRFKATGILGEDLVALVFAPLGTEAISVISLRRASRRERRAYAKG